MAKLYLRHGETFNGDGTSPDAATVEGGVGAFNDMGACFLGTQVGITASDNLYVFTAGNPSWSISGSWAFDGKTMIFDNGGAFGGAFGEFTLAGSGGLGFGNSVIAGNRCCRVTQSSSSHSSLTLSGCNISGVHFEDVATQNHSGYRRGSAYSSIIHDCTFTIVGWGGFSAVQPLFYIYDTNGYSEITDCTINWSTTKSGLFIAQSANNLKIDNLTINGGGVGTYIAYTSGQCAATINGLHLNNSLVDYVYSSAYTYTGSSLTISNITKDGVGYYDSYRISKYCELRTQVDLNYPALNASTLDLGNTKFSTRVEPFMEGLNTELVNLSKYVGVNSITEVTANLLLPQKYLGVTKQDYILSISYFNKAGEKKNKTSDINHDLLDSSLASWTATVYGSESFDPYEIKIGGLDIKDNSIVSVRLTSSRDVVDATDFYFVDPEVVLS